jgi:uncharacterized membrane protein (UPF0127 family)
MAWLVRDGDVLATLEVASTFGERLRGLLGRDGVDGAQLIEHARSVHTLGMRVPIDVAFLDATMTVVDVCSMRTWRPGRPRLRARCVIEAEAGAFERWHLQPGDHLEIKG